MEMCNEKDPEQNNKLHDYSVKPYDHSRWGYRHQQAIVLFVYLVLAYSVRVSLGVIIVAMIDKDMNTTLLQPNNRYNNSNVTELPAAVSDVKTDGFLLMPPHPKLKWSEQQKNFVLAAFYWGYSVMQIPGGQLAHRFGTRRVLTLSMIINSLVLILAPWISYYGGWITMTVSRVLQGVAQGVIFPALHAFFGKWARLEERARLVNYTYSGISLGPLVGMLIGGLTAGSSLGWPGALTVFGVLAAIAAATVWFWIADTPEQHPSISYAEKCYIYEGIGVPDRKKRRRIPWKQILCNPAMIAIAAAHIANAFFLNILHLEAPLFMASVLKVNVKSIGLLMSLPLLMMFLISFVYGWISDLLIDRGWLSVVATRKLLNGFGMVLPAVGLIAMELVPSDVFIVEALLVFIVSTKVASHSGFLLSHIDISPNYAGILLGITSFLALIVSAQVPLITGLIVRDTASLEQWRILFHVTAGILLAAAVLYQLLGTADRAAWDQPTASERAELSGDEGKLMITDGGVAKNTGL